MQYKTSTAAEIAARIEELAQVLTATTGYTPATGVVTYALQGQERIDAERELAEARHVFLPAAQAREVTND